MSPTLPSNRRGFMKMVAASRLRRAQEAAIAARPYAEKMSQVIASLAGGMKDAPVDAVIIGIVDSVDVFGKQIFSAKS